MELTIIKSTPISIFLLLLLLSLPYCSIGSFDVSEKEVYEIDYRGPETHSAIPPPGHGHWVRRETDLPPGHGHWVRRETDLPPPTSSKGLRDANNKGTNAKKIHG